MFNIDKKQQNIDKLGFKRIALYAFLSTITAVSLDVILPAYQNISRTFGDLSASDLQGNILFFIIGMFFGELIFGFLSDVYGRRRIFIFSVLIFMVGSIICFYSPTFFLLLTGRAVQGIGAAGQKICLRAIIRDQYSGARMARLSSFVH